MSNKLIFLFSIFIGLILLEFAVRLYEYLEQGKFNNGEILYEKGNNFKNFKNFFTYYPNSQLRTVGIYSNAYNPTNPRIEYDEIIHTNNFGLVMKNDIPLNSKVNFVLGDSFTEGVGARPWFYDLERKSNKIIANLGFIGTGPKQWLNILEYFVEKKRLKIESIIINIIPDDISRGEWTFNQNQLNCLRFSQCKSGIRFIGLDIAKKSNEEIKKTWLKLKSNSSVIDESHILIKTLKKSRLVVLLNKSIRSVLAKSMSTNVETNFNSLLTLAKISKGKYHINVISQKKLKQKKSKNYELLVSFLEKNNLNFSFCNIPQEDFHKLDSHPTKEGYKFLEKCTQISINQLTK